MGFNGYDVSRSDEALSAFSRACDETISTKFILAEKKISGLLQTIAGYPLLIDFFKSTLSGYNRNAEFAHARSKVGGRSKLILPASKTKLIAFVFCLLLELDTGKRSLKEFLDEFYFSSSPKEQWKSFAQSVIAPFKTVTEYLFINGDDGTADEPIDASLKESVRSLLQELNSLTGKAANVPMDQKQELFLFARSIESALTPNRIDLIRPLMLGYKKTISDCAAAESLMPYYDRLYKALISGDVL